MNLIKEVMVNLTQTKCTHTPFSSPFLILYYELQFRENSCFLMK